MRSLSSKFGVDVAAISRRAKKEEWNEARQQIKKESQQKIVESVSDDYAEIATNIMKAVSVAALKALHGLSEVDPNDSVRLKQYTSILKDLKDIGVFKSDLDREEQKARIDKLHKDIESDDIDNTIIVEFKGNVEDYAN